jgi:hypothetical protein
MNTKTLLSLIVGGLLIVATSYMVLSRYAQNVEIQKEQAYTESRKGVTEGAFAPQFTSEVQSTVSEETPTNNSVETVPTPAPTPVPAPTPKVEGYTQAEVAVHNNETSCYSIIKGKVYDLTPRRRAQYTQDLWKRRYCGIFWTARW